MTTPQGMLELADELQRLCCAETEGKFFDCVTDNISTIILALRQAAAPEGREADKNNADIATMRKRDDDLARAKSISWDDVSVDRPQPDALTPAVAPDGGAMRATLAGFIEAFDSGAVQLSSAEIDASDEHPPYPCMAYGVDQPSQSRPRPPSAGPGKVSMDIGNLHVIDYYLHRALIAMRFAKVTTRMQRARFCIVTDEFDLETEQREGWSI